MKIGVTEENPAETNKVEGNNDTQYPPNAVTGLPFLPSGDRHPRFVQSKCHTMKSAPQYKIPGSPVPQSTEKHGNNQIEILTELSMSVTPQGDIKLIAQPTRQRNVPTPPELGDRG